jgi:hypothetical protein
VGVGSVDPDGEGVAVTVGVVLGEAEADGDVVDGEVAIDELGIDELGAGETDEGGIAGVDEAVAEAEADGDALPVTATLVMSVQSIGRK